MNCPIETTENTRAVAASKKWGTLAGAVGVALAMPSSTQADIVHSGPLNGGLGINIGVDDSHLIDVDGDGNVDFRFFGQDLGFGEDIDLDATGAFAASNGILGGAQLPASRGPAVRLASGASISFVGAASSVAFLIYGGGSNGNFINTSGFVGLRFIAGDGQPHFGWARFAGASTNATLFSYAFEDVANTAIAAGAISTVPEPTSVALGGLGLLAMGSLGLREYRRRKTAADTATD